MRPRTWVLLLGALFAVLQLANVTGRDTPDSRNYLSYALVLRGDSKPEAAEATVAHYCASRASIAHRGQNVHVVRFHRADPAPLVEARCRAKELSEVERRLEAGESAGPMVPFSSERFMRIFEARPGYPLFLVPFVTLFGVTWGLWAAGVTVAVAGGVLVFLILRAMDLPVPLALTGQALYFALPSGAIAMRPMTEGLLMALTLAAVWGCALVLRGRRAGLALIAGSLVALFAVKHSQAMFLGGCLAAAGAAVAVARWRKGGAPGRDLAAITGIGVCAALGTTVLARLLGYPTVAESLQDLLADHFTRPDRERPWAEFWQLSGNFWMEWARRQFWEPFFLAAVAAGVWGALRRPVFGAFVIAAAGTGFLTQAGHPDINIWGGRLLALAWLLPVLGVPMLLEHLVRDRVSLPAQGHADRARSSTAR
ncbi:hypothetical protein [Streptomyces sp. FZ201]|uniref:hypothetical protein n=1 Tax=Streptomyces sp. FZ201 TaxID=3057122 RepID=UPI0021C1B499|nr:hypothetical protein [Streptomyces sp. FZ201]